MEVLARRKHARQLALDSGQLRARQVPVQDNETIRHP
jgi:hypothetical protein